MSKIAIIGGGYTALTAALRLSNEGNEVIILERENQIGGLASGFEIEGTNIEKTYHHLFRTDTDILNLVTELGIEDKLVWQNSSVAIYYENKVYPFMTPFDLLKFKPVSFLDRIKTGLVIFYLQKTKKWNKFKNISAYEFMKKWSGSSALKVIWEPLLKGKFDSFYDQISMAWLWARLHIRANSRKFGETNEKLGYFRGGFNVITEAIKVKLLENKVQIKTGMNVNQILKLKDKLIVKTDKDSFEVDQVLSTIPSYIFSELIKDNSEINKEYINKLKSINYLGALVMVFTSTQDIGKYYWNNINDLDSPFLVFINHTKLIDRTFYNGKYVYYIGAYLPHENILFSETDQEIKKLWFAGLKNIYGEFDPSKVEKTFVFKLRNAQHIVDKGYEEKIPDYKTPIKNLFLSNFSQIYPQDRGTNYAVREGNKIAKIMMSD